MATPMTIIAYVDTVEEFRTEIVAEINRRIIGHQAYQPYVTGIRESAKIAVRVNELKTLVDFISQITILPKKDQPIDPNEYDDPELS